MYFHVLIEVDKEKFGSDRIIEYDIVSEKELYEEYVIPFIKKETISIDGYSVIPEDVKRFIVKSSDVDINSLLKKYSGVEFGWMINISSLVSSRDDTNDITKSVISSAKSIIEKTNEHKEEKKNEHKEEKQINNFDKNKVFIVHGRDDAAKSEVARFIERLRLKAIILHEQTNDGGTIIEKISRYKDCGFSIIIYTPCDKGRLNKEEEKDSLRARQNVVFEHGYFVGVLGRDKVCTLRKGNVEMPSDINGIGYIDMDGGQGWHLSLARELKAAGYNIDLNKIM